MNELSNIPMLEHLTPEQREAMAKMLSSPVSFAKGVFGHDPWSGQVEMLEAVMKHNAVAVKACHSSSKTFAAAELTLWWLCRYPDGIVLTTSPTARQVESLLWGEIHKFLNTRISDGFMPFPEPNVAKLTLHVGNYAMGFSTSPENAGVNFHGYHGSHLLVIVDEALGVAGPICEAIDGIRAGGEVHVLVLCNPTSSAGPVYKMFTVNRAHWHTITIDAFDTPNLKGFTLDYLRQLPAGLSEDHPVFQYKPRPYLVTRWWVYDMYQRHGETSPVWRSRVRGEFPAGSG